MICWDEQKIKQIDARNLQAAAVCVLGNQATSLFLDTEIKVASITLLTANTPPGNRHTVNPTASSSLPGWLFAAIQPPFGLDESVVSDGNSWRQTGQELREDAIGMV
ncbi:hypothetical protein L1987_35941 [Smallanthus sonchifolius]|uniref:Uncharacterized protein n=1 Tax=Smallanthus sonchifolius TaxID=185202 RepID=A0ACB9HC77_9ASTR|nr:hypothetical protein L1987_35941 [Smallanthus sonchifolius]